MDDKVVESDSVWGCSLYYILNIFWVQYMGLGSTASSGFISATSPCIINLNKVCKMWVTHGQSICSLFKKNSNYIPQLHHDPAYSEILYIHVCQYYRNCYPTVQQSHHEWKKLAFTDPMCLKATICSPKHNRYFSDSTGSRILTQRSREKSVTKWVCSPFVP